MAIKWKSLDLNIKFNVKLAAYQKAKRKAVWINFF
jgi:hypothetical protein